MLKSFASNALKNRTRFQTYILAFGLISGATGLTYSIVTKKIQYHLSADLRYSSINFNTSSEVIAEKINYSLSLPRFSSSLYRAFQKQSAQESADPVFGMTESEFVFAMISDNAPPPVSLSSKNGSPNYLRLLIKSPHSHLKREDVSRLAVAINQTVQEINGWLIDEAKKNFLRFFEESKNIKMGIDFADLTTESINRRWLETTTRIKQVASKNSVPVNLELKTVVFKDPNVTFFRDWINHPINIDKYILADFVNWDNLLLKVYDSRVTDPTSELAKQLVDLKAAIWRVKMEFQLLSFVKATQTREIEGAVAFLNLELTKVLPSFLTEMPKDIRKTTFEIFVKYLFIFLGYMLAGISGFCFFRYFYSENMR